jgi:diketogulonate reductase-like aldo/keto reductase
MAFKGVVRVGALEMPQVGFGTYKVGVVPASAAGASAAPAGGGAEEVHRSLGFALDAGYRMFDCAQFYENEHWIGEAFDALLPPRNIKREDLFIISKVWPNVMHEGTEAIHAQCRKTIAELKCGFLDAYLVHWPLPGKHVAAFQALEALKAEGLVREIGVSNYTVEDMEELKAAGTSKPAMNQIEINPLLFRKKTIEYFKNEGVHLQSYRGLMQAAAWSDCAPLQQVCSETGKAPSQVLGRWLVQHGFSHVPKASAMERTAMNIALDFELSDEQMAALNDLTTEKQVQKFKEAYLKGIVRDTPVPVPDRPFTAD